MKRKKGRAEVKILWQGALRDVGLAAWVLVRLRLGFAMPHADSSDATHLQSEVLPAWQLCN